MSVPYIFANSTGNIPLSHLDANFSNVKAQVDSADVVRSSSQPNITSVGNLTSLVVSGNVVSGNISGTSGVFSTLIGNLNASYLTSGTIPTGRLSGSYPISVSSSSTAGTVTTNAQPNITSVGTLTSLTASGNITGSYFIGNGSQLTGIVANSTYSDSNVTSLLASFGSNTITTTGNISVGSSSATVYKTTSVSLGSVTGSIAIDVSAGGVQTFTTGGNISLSFTNWPASGIYSEVTLVVNVSNISHVITGPAGLKNAFGIIGLNYAASTMKFPKADIYTFTFSSSDGGTTIAISENNTLLRPYNSSSEAITSTSNASISLGESYSIYYPSPLNSSGTAYLTNGIPGLIKTIGSLGTSTWTVTVPGSSWGGSNQINFNSAGQNITLVWSDPFSAWFVLNTVGNVTVS